MISVLIINYNTAHLIARAIASVQKQKGVEFALFVLDNNSPDNSVEVLKALPGKFELVINSKNVGYGCANNLLFKQVRTPYVYFLNPDAWLKEADTLLRLVDYMEKHPQYGIVATDMRNEAGEREFDPYTSCYIGARHLKHPLPPLPGHIAWVLGASMAMPSHVFEAMKGFDEDYFLYCEDVDLCLRVRKAGYPIQYLPELVIGHTFGASEKRSIYKRLVKQQLSRRCFYHKHYHPEDADWLIKREIKRARRRLLRARILYALTRNVRYQARNTYFRAVIEAEKFRGAPPV